jgi:hypothetical protein
MEQDAGREVDGHRAAVGDRVGDPIAAKREGPGADLLPRDHLVELRPVANAMLLELPFQ